MIHTLIGIIGPTCSGKSTISGIVEKLIHVNTVSFGRYLLNYSQERSLPTDKPSLQDLGNSFIQSDPRGFLTNVLAHGLTGEKTVLIEGIRHKQIFFSLKSMSKNSFFIYVDAECQLRYLRYCQRNNYIPNSYPFDEFQSMEDHAVEAEIASLKTECDNIIQNDNIELSALNTIVSSIVSSNLALFE